MLCLFIMMFSGTLCSLSSLASLFGSPLPHPLKKSLPTFSPSSHLLGQGGIRIRGKQWGLGLDGGKDGIPCQAPQVPVTSRFANVTQVGWMNKNILKVHVAVTVKQSKFIRFDQWSSESWNLERNPPVGRASSESVS